MKRERKRSWVILRHNFIFCFATDVAEIPGSVIRLDKSTVEKKSVANAEEELRLRREMGKQDIVEKQVARWLGIEENEPRKKIKKRSPAVKKKFSSQNLTSSADLRGRFAFTLVEQDVVHEFGCDTMNSMNIWISACENFTYWFEEFDFNKGAMN